MVDWPGILKWSTQYHDSNKAPSQFSQLSEEDKQWLYEAFDDFTYKELNRIKQIIVDLQKPEEDEDSRVGQLEELQEYIDSLDRGKQFCQLGGGMVLFNKVLVESQYEEAKFIGNLIFQSIVQNCSETQDFFIRQGAFSLINLFLNEQSQKVKEVLISSISSMIRGEHLEGKRQFIDVDGIQFLLKLINEENYSNKIITKCYNLLKDLVFYDQRLKYTFNDLSPFMNNDQKLILNQKAKELIEKNSQGSQVNSNKNNNNQIQLYEPKLDVKQDQNQNLMLENELEKNKKYQNIVKQLLIKNQFIENNLDKITNNTDPAMTDSRQAFFEIFLKMLQFDKSFAEQNKINKEIMDKLKGHFTNLYKLNEQQKEIVEDEAKDLKALIAFIKNEQN